MFVRTELRPLIDSTMPLPDGCAAFERMRDGNLFGKIAATMDG